jgi:hypothetical protein
MLLKKIFFVHRSGILLFLVSLLCFGASAQNKQIDTLNFIYKKGFKMHLSGERILYDSYNFPKSKSPSFLEYSITEEKQKGKENVMRFQSSQCEEKDTTSYGSYLYINDEGMFFWLWDEAKKMKEKTKTQPISLPLRQGKVWDSYYGKHPARMECISTDSLVKTPLGNFNTFVVKVTFTDNSEKGYDKEITMVDFYDAHIGQVEMQMSATAIFKKEDKIRKKISDMTLLADKITKAK